MSRPSTARATAGGPASTPPTSVRRPQLTAVRRQSGARREARQELRARELRAERIARRARCRRRTSSQSSKRPLCASLRSDLSAKRVYTSRRPSRERTRGATWGARLRREVGGATCEARRREARRRRRRRAVRAGRGGRAPTPRRGIAIPTTRALRRRRRGARRAGRAGAPGSQQRRRVVRLRKLRLARVERVR